MTTLTQRLSRVIRNDIQGAAGYAIQPSAGFMKLDAMENPFALPVHLQRELGERLARVALNRYPQGKAALAERVATYAEVPPGCRVILGNGSDELIDILSLACSKPGASILAPVPGFVMYEMSAKFRGMRFVGVPLTAGFELDEAALLEAVAREKPSLTYLAYPNNPTANLFDERIVERVVAAVGEQGGLVVFDEAYQPFSSRTWMGKLAAHDHVLVLRTFSKFGLAGVRLGYLAGRREVIDEVDKCSPPYNISALNLEATHFALDHAAEFARQATVLRDERARLLRELAANGAVKVFPSEANMILVRVPDSKAAFEGMKRRGVLVKHIAGMHPLLANCLRLTVGAPDENTAMIRALYESIQDPAS